MRQLQISRQITSRNTISIDKYLHDIARFQLLPPHEEASLAKKIKAGDHQALDTLIKANLRFVVSVSKQYQNRGMGLTDLISEGNLGLIKAAKLFDETRGFKFISYAVWWIRQSIIQALAEQSRIVRIPSNKIGFAAKIKFINNKLAQELKREPSIVEIACALDTSVKLVEETLTISVSCYSLDAPLDDGEQANLYDLIINESSPSPDKSMIQHSLTREIERTLSRLRKRDAEMLSQFYGLNGYHSHNLREIATKFGVSTERVRQIIEQSLKKLKHLHRDKRLLEEYPYC